MDIRVEVSRNRKCSASIDWVRNPPAGHFVMSFGDLSRPNQDVEIEFSEKQLKELEATIKEAYGKVDHSGWC